MKMSSWDLPFRMPCVENLATLRVPKVALPCLLLKFCAVSWCYDIICFSFLSAFCVYMNCIRSSEWAGEKGSLIY